MRRDHMRREHMRCQKFCIVEESSRLRFGLCAETFSLLFFFFLFCSWKLFNRLLIVISPATLSISQVINLQLHWNHAKFDKLTADNSKITDSQMFD